MRAEEIVAQNRTTMEALHAAENEGWKSVPPIYVQVRPAAGRASTCRDMNARLRKDSVQGVRR